MAVLGWVWLSSPFALIALVSRNPSLQRLVASHYAHFLAAGWTGAVMMFVGAAVVPGPLGTAMFTVGTPLTGLVVFLRRDDGDDGGGDEADGPPVDWNEFERSFWTHVRGDRSPHRPPGRPLRDAPPASLRGGS